MLLVLLNPGTTVPLLLDNSFAVPVVIIPVEVAYLGQMLGSVTVASQPVRLSGSSNLLWCGGWFGRTWGLSFLLAARRSRFCCNSLSLFLRYHSRFACFAFSGVLLGISNNTANCPGRWTISRVPSANHRSRSRLRGDSRSLYPWGGPPLIFLLSIKPLT